MPKARGQKQGTWKPSRNAKGLGKKNAGDAAKLAAAQKAETDAGAKLAAARERTAKATPKPDRAVDPAYHNSDRQDLP